jgi:hypothetical protein
VTPNDSPYLVEWKVLDKLQRKDSLGGEGTHLVLVVERSEAGKTFKAEKTVSGVTWDHVKVGDSVHLQR